MHGGTEHHAIVRSQQLLKLCDRHAGGLVDHQQAASLRITQLLVRMTQQHARLAEAKAVLIQLALRQLDLQLAQQGLHRIGRGREQHQLARMLTQQAAQGRAQSGAFAASAIGSQHQRALGMTERHLVHRLHHGQLISIQGKVGSRRRRQADRRN